MNALNPVFTQSLAGCIGIEREFTLMQNGESVPRSPEFLAHMAKRMQSLGLNTERWAPELSACQVEDRTLPQHTAYGLSDDLDSAQKMGCNVAEKMSCLMQAVEVVPAHVACHVHEKYLHLREKLPRSVLMAAYRVAGVHVHIGCASLQQAVEFHDALCTELPAIVHMTDHTNGERLGLYHQVVAHTMGVYAPHLPGTSPLYKSITGWEDRMRALGVTKLAECYDLVRISHYGTVELRTPGMTDSVDEIIGWVERIRSLVGLPIF